MLRKMTLLLFAILLGYATAGFAGDYVLDASTMGVGATAGENLVVKEGCLDPTQTTCPEKLKWLRAPLSKIGSLEILGNLQGNFEISVTVDFDNAGKGIVLTNAENKGIQFAIVKAEDMGVCNGYSSFWPVGIGTGGGEAKGCGAPYGFNRWNNFNNITITVQNGTAKAHINGQQNGGDIAFDPSTTFSRVVIQGITSDDRLSEVRTKGLQTSCAGGGSTTTITNSTVTQGDCTADYAATGSLHVPCVRVPGAFGKTELYDVWMQQKFPSYSFELDMNRVTVK